jgi:phosphoglycerol transferase MdoB-like AlkP superfamily enzyme
MRKSSFNFLKLFLFWIASFFIHRVVFVIYHVTTTNQSKLSDYWQIFWNSIPLDLSMAAYFVAIPLVLFFITLFISKTNQLLNFCYPKINYFFIVLISIIDTIDLHIYTEWGTKVNSRAIDFLINSPSEALASSASSPLLLGISLFLLQLIFLLWVYQKYINSKFEKINFKYSQLLAIPGYSLILILLLRGGTQLAPINQSAAYFSNNSLYNHAAVNTEWNLMASILQNNINAQNPYQFVSDSVAKNEILGLYPTTNDESSNQILTIPKPNIVLVILESFTSDVVGAFGGEANVCPSLSKIANEGIAFDSIYASGDRTDKGLIAILSAFPSQAVRSIIHQPDKFEKLASLPQSLKENGYEPFFLYGGESEFANFKSYLLSTGINHIVDRNDFESSQMNSKWGAHDGYLFDKLHKELETKKQPFFAITLTLSSHEPFEIPIASSFKGEDLPQLFRKSANYTDQCIEKFMQAAKKEKWYKQTLFVFVADHGHRLPKAYRTAYDFRKFRIPLIFAGDVIKPEFKGKRIHMLGSQTDLAATILSQLKIEHQQFNWSKDLLNKDTKPFAFYSYDNGFGWVNPAQTIVQDNINKQIIFNSQPKLNSEENLRKGQSYMQKVFEEYLAY